MQNSQTMSIRSRWLNFIMHLTAAIAERKQDLTKHHALKTFFDFISIVLLEGVLAIVSIPLYFSSRSSSLSPENEFNVQYSIRKTLIFAVFAFLIIIFTLKVFFVGKILWEQSSRPLQTTNHSLVSAAVLDSNFLSATVDQKMAPPTISHVGMTEGGTVLINGNAQPSAQIVLSIAQKNSEAAQPAMQMLLTQSDKNGQWQVATSALFHLKAGSYLFQAQVFDAKLQQKSPLGVPLEYTVQTSASESFIAGLDFVANALLVSFLAIGFLVIFLTF